MEKRKVITAGPDSFAEYVTKVWEYRALVLSFAKRDIRVKYAQTWLGVGWTIVQPLTGVVIFTFFFGYILGWKAGALPYPLHVLSGLMAWNFFGYIVFQGTGSLQESAHLIQKVYFPKLLLPLAKILPALLELGITSVLLLLLMVFYGIGPSWKMIFLPLVLVINILCAFSLVTWVGAFSYRFRDLMHLVPYLMYFGVWLTPVFFTIDTLPEKLRFIWYLNPMAGVVEAWRACLFGGGEFGIRYLPAMLLTVPAALLGIRFYARKESEFGDYA